MRSLYFNYSEQTKATILHRPSTNQECVGSLYKICLRLSSQRNLISKSVIFTRLTQHFFIPTNCPKSSYFSTVTFSEDLCSFFTVVENLSWSFVLLVLVCSVNHIFYNILYLKGVLLTNVVHTHSSAHGGCKKSYKMVSFRSDVKNETRAGRISRVIFLSLAAFL